MVEYRNHNPFVMGLSPIFVKFIFNYRENSLVVRVLACHVKCRGFNSRFSRIYEKIAKGLKASDCKSVNN